MQKVKTAGLTPYRRVITNNTFPLQGGATFFRGHSPSENYASFRQKNPNLDLTAYQTIILQNLFDDPFGPMHTNSSQKETLTTYGARFIQRLVPNLTTEDFQSLLKALHQNPNLQLSPKQQDLLDGVLMAPVKAYQNGTKLKKYGMGLFRCLASGLPPVKNPGLAELTQPFISIQDELKGLAQTLKTQKARLSPQESKKLTSCLERAEMLVGKLQQG